MQFYKKIRTGIAITIFTDSRWFIVYHTGLVTILYLTIYFCSSFRNAMQLSSDLQFTSYWFTIREARLLNSNKQTKKLEVFNLVRFSLINEELRSERLCSVFFIHERALEIKFQDVKNAIVSNMYKQFLGLLIIV